MRYPVIVIQNTKKLKFIFSEDPAVVMFLEFNLTLQLEILELKTDKTVILKIFTIYLPVEHKILAVHLLDLLGHKTIYLLGHKILTIYLLVEHVHLLGLLGHKIIYLLGPNILTIQLVLTQIPTEKDQVLAQVN